MRYKVGCEEEGLAMARQCESRCFVYDNKGGRGAVVMMHTTNLHVSAKPVNPEGSISVGIRCCSDIAV
jgi:hypothetical protein